MIEVAIVGGIVDYYNFFWSDMENKTLYSGENEDKKISENLASKLYKCESCGNFLRFDPLLNKLKCDHCDSVVDIIAVGRAQELVYTELSEREYEPWQEKAIKCEACGAVSVLGNYQTTLNCPFCGASNIATIDSVEGLKPNAILPFKIDKARAGQLQKSWIKKRIFAPLPLKKQSNTKEISGIYIPYFTFDTYTCSTYSIRYGEYYTVVVGSGKDRRTETYTRWYCDSGTYDMNFDDIQIEASEHLNAKQKEKLDGFDTGNCVSYHSQYIAGFSSERYSQGLDESWKQAQDETYNPIKKGILARYNYDTIDYVNITTDFNNVKYKYALVPVWLLKYDYKKKNYGCVINGRNGKVVGKTPLSPIRVSSAVVVTLAVIGVIAWLCYKFLF